MILKRVFSEVRLYLAQGKSADTTLTGYPINNEYPLLVFLRQSKKDESNIDKVEQYLQENGWKDINVMQSAKVAPDKLDTVGDPNTAQWAYSKALKDGGAIIVFREANDGQV